MRHDDRNSAAAHPYLQARAVTPPSERSTLPSAGRLGLVDEAAPSFLAQIGWNDETSVELMWSLSRSPDADLALKTVVRLSELLADDWAELDQLLRTDKRLRGRLLGLAGSSSELADHLVSDASRWRILTTHTDRLPTSAELTETFLGAVNAEPETGPCSSGDLYRAALVGPHAIAALRAAYRNQVMLLAAADLAATVENEPVVPYEVVARHLSDMADAALTAALAVAVAVVFPDEPCSVRLAVIAMGKCGAQELNYVSDVDVVFVCEPSNTRGARLAGEMMRVGSSAFFEVDAALRPEGKQGELVRTLDSHISYYQNWAKTWEFQALLKARAMTGDAELGQRYIDAVNPMVWTASERNDFVPEVQAMRRRVESLVPEELREREIKLGRGGLRDVEFAVQLLQLVHGRSDESLRTLGTIESLSALAVGGYVGRDDAANLAASYEFLRLIEHRLQLQRMRRTHTLPAPDDVEAMRWLARAAHMRPDGNNDALGVLREEIKRNAQRIRRLHARLFYRPLLESVANMDADTIRLSPESAKRQLSALGYSAPEHALSHLSALASMGGARRGRIQTVLLPTLLEWLGRTPDPDAGLLAYRRLSESMVDQPWFLRLVRDEGPVANRLMQVLGSSAYLQDILLNAPEIIRLFADSASGPRLLEVDPTETYGAILAASARHEDPVRAVAAARSLRRYELARVAAADILGLLDVPEVCRALSSVWAAVINAALDAAVRASVAERGSPAPATIAVIGMGRLGGLELGYGSDADVLFVCETVGDAEDSEAARWANLIADRVRKLLGSPSQDPPLEVDTGLRPEGRNGPVVRSLSAYDAYYSQWAQPWEVQALLRAHQVAGDQDLGVRFLLMADKIRYPEGGMSEESVREIRRIKARVDAERLPKGADPMTNTKLGRGGLADVEWTVQLIQLRHAHRIPALHNTSTLQSLDAIGAAELLSPGDVELLREAWLTATKARNALVLVKGKPSDQLPGPGKILSAVAQVAGKPGDDAGEFLDNYLRVTRRAKRVVEKAFGGR